MRWFPALLLCACGSLTTPNGPGVNPTTGTVTGNPVGVAGTGTGTGTGSTGPGGCLPIDEWDDETLHAPGAGDTCSEAPKPLAPIGDDGGPAVTLSGNIHEDGDVDWFVIDAVDLPGDGARGFEDFHLQIAITEGVAAVQMVVVPMDCGNVADCDADGGYTEYSFYSEDTSPDPDGGYPVDSRACGAVNDPVLDECPDYSGPYLVKITSVDGLEKCAPYELTISNGIW